MADQKCESTNKIAHPTMAHATKAAYHMDSQYPGERYEPYKCQYCSGYHIGHAPDAHDIREKVRDIIDWILTLRSPNTEILFAKAVEDLENRPACDL